MNILTNILPEKQPVNSWIGVDLEIFKAEKHRLHRPDTGKFASLQIATDPETVHFLTDEKLIRPALRQIEDSIWIFHNAKFDLTHLRRWAKIKPRLKLWDTMIAERILYGGYYDKFRLSDLSRRHLDTYLEKESQSEFGETEEFTEEMIQYACRDAAVLIPIAKKQMEAMDKNDFTVWTKVDRPALWAILDSRGFALDTKAWGELANRNRARADKIQEELPFNFNSWQQVKEALIEAGFEDLPSTGKKVLELFTKKFPDVEAVELAETVLEGRQYSKRASTYGTNYFSKYIEIDIDVPVVFPDWYVTGAETGRMSCSDPNLMNIPSRDTLEFRECFIHRTGNKLVVADYSQQEPRITAFMSQDKAMIEAFNSGEDIYSLVASKRYGKKIEKSDPRRRLFKDLVLGVIYGLSPWGFAEKAGVTEDEATALMDDLFDIFPDLWDWIEAQEKKKTYVETIIGRKVWLNPYDFQSSRNARNSPIQGSAADQLKMAVGAMHQNWSFHVPFSLVGLVHDELIFDVPEKIAPDVAKFVEKHMIEVAETMCPGVKFGVDTHICDQWSEAKE